MSRPHVFISHAWGVNAQGHVFAKLLRDDLKEKGIRSWIDSDNNGAGCPIDFKIRESVRKCPAFIVVICDLYLSRPQCQLELDQALVYDKKPIPVVRVKVDKELIPEGLLKPVEIERLDMSELLSYREALPILIKKIRQRCRLFFWMFVLRITGLILMICCGVWFILPLERHNRVSYDNDTDVLIHALKYRITTPESGKTAKFVLGGGQGGKVVVLGECPVLETGKVILLTVTASDGIERPQTHSPKGIVPDTKGNWSSTLQVGDDDFPPEPGQVFTVKMYVLSGNDYTHLKAQAGPKGAPWPIPDQPLPALDTCSFSLVQ